MRISAAVHQVMNDSSQTLSFSLGAYIFFFFHHKLLHWVLSPEERHSCHCWLALLVFPWLSLAFLLMSAPNTWKHRQFWWGIHFHDYILLSSCPLLFMRRRVILENFIMSSRLVQINVSLKEDEEERHGELEENLTPETHSHIPWTENLDATKLLVLHNSLLVLFLKFDNAMSKAYNSNHFKLRVNLYRNHQHLPK